ncbi:hypothetical protein E1262_18305 [Jiangella aurantiaca]|uniref:Uncharacterized protein n=1 Tax=Jiangella aurantiaca TaxID=2530373 RepID=A0A4R5A7I5_9ACTN|nr:hypothetical protein [Jiangella aurantiaca]TDD67605.1 hypothetical protein E1262_18305 [Jiangella aurantiaca]
MDVPVVTEELVRQLRDGYPHAALVYAGGGVLRVRRPHGGVVEGEHLYSSQRLDTWRPAAGGAALSDSEHAARLTEQLTPVIEELVARERAEVILGLLNSYVGTDIWADVIEQLPDLDRRIPPEYPSYVRSAYDQRHHDANATTAEFVALGERVTFSLDRRENRWQAAYTKRG